MERIYKEHVKEAQGRHKEIPIINVLPKESYLKEHIPGSINIPFESQDQFIRDVENATKSKGHKVILYCSSEECDCSEKAAKALEEAEFPYVLLYTGGMQDWKKSGEVIESGNKKQ
ncbi:MAG: rhodanese-like domain-containing protein [Waddliaceae bacterium]